MNAIAEPVQASHSRERSALGWLRSRRRLVFGGLAVTLLLMAGTFGRPWLEALGIGSVVLGLLPCAAMCAVGLCMEGHGGCSKQGGAHADAEAPPGDRGAPAQT